MERERWRGTWSIAAHTRLDKFHLCRALRDEVGSPPHAYVTHRGVSRAQGLLAGGMSQAEVAASVGLYDQSRLHRHFKRPRRDARCFRACRIGLAAIGRVATGIDQGKLVAGGGFVRSHTANLLAAA